MRDVAGFTVNMPLSATLPTPESEADVAFSDVHVSVAASPGLASESGTTVSVHLGGFGGGGGIITVEHCAVPPGPLTVSTYGFEETDRRILDPLTGTPPMPLLIDAEVALEDDH